VITELPQKRPKVRPLKAQLDAGKRTKLSTHPTLYNKREQIKQGSSPCCATTTAEGNMQTLMTHQTLGNFELEHFLFR
jgi:hypothetical protein